MSKPIAHNVHTFSLPIVDVIHNVRSGQKLFNNSTFNVLAAANVAGGFIAGGFAATFAKAFVKSGSDTSVWEGPVKNVDDGSCDVLQNYIGQRYGFTKFQWESGDRRFKAKSGDIDIYFPDVASANRALESTRHFADVIVKPSSAGFGTEYACVDSDGEHGQLIQMITCYTGSPAKVVSTFDIYNAACVIDGNKLMIPVDWEWLLKERLLHIHSWRSDFALNRISKWSRKHGYHNGLTPGSFVLLNEHIEELLEMAVNGKFNAFGKVVSPKEIAYGLHPFLKNFTPENLMRLSPYDTGSGYNHAMKELCKRSEATLQNNEPSCSVV